MEEDNRKARIAARVSESAKVNGEQNYAGGATAGSSSYNADKRKFD